MAEAEFGAGAALDARACFDALDFDSSGALSANEVYGHLSDSHTSPIDRRHVDIVFAAVAAPGPLAAPPALDTDLYGDELHAIGPDDMMPVLSELEHRQVRGGPLALALALTLARLFSPLLPSSVYLRSWDHA